MGEDRWMDGEKYRSRFAIQMKCTRTSDGDDEDDDAADVAPTQETRHGEGLAAQHSTFLVPSPPILVSHNCTPFLPSFLPALCQSLSQFFIEINKSRKEENLNKHLIYLPMRRRRFSVGASSFLFFSFLTNSFH